MGVFPYPDLGSNETGTYPSLMVRARLIVHVLSVVSVFLSPASPAYACDGPFTPDPEKPGTCVWTGGSGTYTGGYGGSGGTFTPYDPSAPTTSTSYSPVAAPVDTSATQIAALNKQIADLQAEIATLRAEIAKRVMNPNQLLIRLLRRRRFMNNRFKNRTLD